MSEIIVHIALCLALPIALLCFYLERRARRIMMSVLFGIADCLLAYYINSFISEQLNITRIQFVSFVTPIVEEILKTIPILIVTLGLKKGTRGSISNAFAVGVGFCIVENYLYLFEYFADVNVGWVIARCVGTGLMHSMSAAIIGLGILYVRNRNHTKWLGVTASLLAAIVYHGLFNFLVGTSSLKIIGVILPPITFVAVFILEKNGRFYKFINDTKNQNAFPKSKFKKNS